MARSLDPFVPAGAALLDAIRDLTRALQFQRKAVLNASETAEYLGISRPTFNEIKHLLPSFTPPGTTTVRYPRFALDQLIQQQVEERNGVQ